MKLIVPFIVALLILVAQSILVNIFKPSWLLRKNIMFLSLLMKFTVILFSRAINFIQWLP